MIRVGFLFEGGDGWLGGVNYFWNLLFALTALPGRTLQPVLLASPTTVLHGLDQIDGVEVVKTDLAAGATSVVARSMGRRLLGRDEWVARLCAIHRIDVLSHSGSFGWRMPVATAPWIPDLQHRRLPEYFSFRERRVRDYGALHQLLEGDRTIVSSEAAANDCRRFYGAAARRVDVLRFVSQPRVRPEALPSKTSLRERFDLGERFFFLPNQFWRHKNHEVVVAALARISRLGAPVQVVLTGKGDDYRAPDHYRALMARVASLGLTRSFRHLGTVDFPDLMGLMLHSIAVINPSLFEGWSTSVEEARSLGKATLLSDIDVHREQDPPGARYFAPADDAALAVMLGELWSSHEDGHDAERRRVAADSLPARTAAFGRRYEEIIHAALARARSRPEDQGTSRTP